MSLGVAGRSRVFEFFLTAALAASGTLPAFAAETSVRCSCGRGTGGDPRLASQANVQISGEGRERHGQAARMQSSGELSTDQGLQTLLLADSGLTPQYVGERSDRAHLESELEIFRCRQAQRRSEIRQSAASSASSASSIQNNSGTAFIWLNWICGKASGNVPVAEHWGDSPSSFTGSHRNRRHGPETQGTPARRAHLDIRAQRHQSGPINSARCERGLEPSTRRGRVRPPQGGGTQVIIRGVAAAEFFSIADRVRSLHNTQSRCRCRLHTRRHCP